MTTPDAVARGTRWVADQVTHSRSRSSGPEPNARRITGRADDPNNRLCCAELPATQPPSWQRASAGGTTHRNA